MTQIDLSAYLGEEEGKQWFKAPGPMQHRHGQHAVILFQPYLKSQADHQRLS